MTSAQFLNPRPIDEALPSAYTQAYRNGQPIPRTRIKWESPEEARLAQKLLSALHPDFEFHAGGYAQSLP